MHDRGLVTFLNGFADTSQALPRGWEEKTDQYGQVDSLLLYLKKKFYDKFFYDEKHSFDI